MADTNEKFCFFEYRNIFSGSLLTMAFLRKFLKYEIHSLRIAFISSLFGVLFMIVAISTPEWTKITYNLGHKTNKSIMVSIHEHYGIWRYCKSELHIIDGEVSGKINNSCTKSDVLLSDTEYTIKYKAVAESHGTKDDDRSKGYFTSRAIFAAVSIFMMVLTLVFNAYSIYRPRYTLKRLTAVLYLMSAISSFMSMEMFLEEMGYHENRIKLDGARHLTISYGYSFTLNCLVFIIYLIGCVIFLAFCSKIKPKDGPQPHEERLAAENDAPLAL